MGCINTKSKKRLEQARREYEEERIRDLEQKQEERARKHRITLEHRTIVYSSTPDAQPEKKLIRETQQENKLIIKESRPLKEKLIICAPTPLSKLSRTIAPSDNTPVPIVPLHHVKKPYTSTKIQGAEYSTVASKFRSTGKAIMHIQCIEKIENPFVRALYAQKMKQGQYVETELFHGTPAVNAESICKENFDYRVCGRGVGVRYGDGVSFSPFSYYASHYCDKGEVKVMFLCKVLVGSEQEGYKGLKVPIRGFDTSVKRNKRDPKKKDVYVKFDDDTFYPEYKITFKMTTYNNYY